MTTLSFRLPEQRPPAADSFDTRAGSVRLWVEQLPMGHIGETARRLYEMLHEVNRLELAPAVRFELLESVEQTLVTVLDNLERHYTGMPFPLQAKSVRVAKFSNSLLRELINAYQATLNGEEDASWLFRMTHTHMWVVCIYRLLHYLNRMLTNYRHIHRPPAGGLWQACHQLYLEAREHKRLREKVAGPDGEEVSIEEEYKRALLLSMIEPQLFRRSQSEELQATLPYWARRCRLLESERRPQGMVGYCVRTDQDVPHTILNDSCSDCSGCDEGRTGFLLDMEELNQTLNDLVERMGEADSARLDDGDHVLSRETIETLLLCWRLPQSARSERVRAEQAVEVAIGMSVVHALLRGSEGGSARGISDQVMKEDLEELAIQADEKEDKGRLLQPAVGREKKGRDVWDSIFYATEMTHQKAWAKETEEREIRFNPALLCNFNETGYGVRIPPNSNEPVQVGELVGFRRAADEPTELCVVRWLGDSDKAIALGLKRLAGTVEAVLLVIHVEQRKTALYGLLGIGDDRVPLLFIPYLPNIRDKRLYLVVDGKEVPVTLHDKVTLSPLFEAYHFAVAEGLKGASSIEEEMTLEELNERMHDITLGRAHRGDEDFSDLWHSL